MKKELNKILVPVDFNEQSKKAVLYALNLAKNFNGEILLLHVINTPGFLADFFSKGDHLVRITDQAKNKMSEIKHNILKEGHRSKIITRVEPGKPYETILKVASEIDARFIILAENHQGEEAAKDLGSTVYHVTLKSIVPVITLKGDFTQIGSKILVPLDLTKQTSRQLSSALLYGKNYGTEIHLVSALIGGVDLNASRIYQKISQAKNMLEENGVACQIKLFEKSDIPPFKRVLEYANEIDTGMILLMTHQEGYTYDNYIGAFAHQIINQSKVPVLSLTSNALHFDDRNILKGIVDPVGLLINE